jgi:imidazole glycerol-phosphate synthase subunit HisH
MRKDVVIINYGMGNVDSVKRAIEECGGSAVVSRDTEVLDLATHIILPGVGNFKTGMEHLLADNIISQLEEQVIHEKKPFLGICLGMQLLADIGWESGETRGLGWIHGEIKRFLPNNDSIRIPHIGWNEVHFTRDNPLFAGIESGKDFYFVHSYHYMGCRKEEILGTTPYGCDFPAIVNKENIYGVQFHPEKSQKTGFELIKNFLAVGD